MPRDTTLPPGGEQGGGFGDWFGRDWNWLKLLGGGLGAGALGWLFGSGDKPEQPTKPQMGEFEPYLGLGDEKMMGAMKQYLEGYGQEQRKGMAERSAQQFGGGVKGPGTYMPGEIQLAQTQQQAMAQAMMQQQKMQQMAVQQQYMAYIGQKYGYDSMEYEQQWKTYQDQMSAEGQGTSDLLSGLMQGAGSILPFFL